MYNKILSIEPFARKASFFFPVQKLGRLILFLNRLPLNI